MKRHGMRYTRAYRIWTGMMSRCRNPRAHAFERYGGRGIMVCDRWLDFAAFFEDMGDPPQGKTLDRIDNERGYSKENCRWATSTEQNNNSSANVHVTAFGVTKPLKQWAAERRIKYTTLYARLFRSRMSAEQAIAMGEP